MNKAEVKSLESMFISVTNGMKVMSAATKALSGRISRLEAENKELRELWNQCESMIIVHKSEESELREGLANLILASNRRQFPKV